MKELIYKIYYTNGQWVYSDDLNKLKNNLINLGRKNIADKLKQMYESGGVVMIYPKLELAIQKKNVVELDLIAAKYIEGAKKFRP